MKTKYRIISLLVSIIMMAMVATAHPQTTDNMHKLVKQQLENGKPVDMIVRDSLLWEGMTQERIVKILYCLGVPGEDIKYACDSNGIPESELVAGYKRSVAECDESIVDTQAYTPMTSTPMSFMGASPSFKGGGTSISPSNFK